jgi:hypothetical protein
MKATKVLTKTSAKTWVGTKVAGNHGRVTVEVRKEMGGYSAFHKDANKFMGMACDTLAEMKEWMAS